MYLRVRTFWTSLFILLFIAMAIGSQLPVTADPPTKDDAQTNIGKPIKISNLGNEENPAPHVPDTRLPVIGSELDNMAFLPLVTNTPLSPEQQRVVDLVNAERSQAGCAPLRVSDQLTLAAQGHSEDMALYDFFSHTSFDGRSPWDRIRKTGYDYSSAAENIAAGYSMAASAVSAWMNSSGHRANILNCGLEETGVGYYYLENDTGNVNYGHYWTQVFASP